MNRQKTIRILLSMIALLLAGTPLIAAETKATYDILETKDHDATLYTQGLIVDGDNLVESTGLYGESRIVRYNTETGEQVHSASLPDSIFAEGIHRLDDSIFLLTWKEQRAYRLNAETFAIEQTFKIKQQGWGLTHNGQHFIQSDGSNVLYFRNSSTFEIEKSVPVFRGRLRIRNLNELEYARGLVWANVYMTSTILAIQPTSGEVAFTLDLSDIAAKHSDIDLGHVLNGIAYDASRDAFWVTGKCWNKRYLINIKTPGDPQDDAARPSQ